LDWPPARVFVEEGAFVFILGRRQRDGNDPSVDIAKDADQRF